MGLVLLSLPQVCSIVTVAHEALGGPIFPQRPAWALFSMRLFIRLGTRICLLFSSLWKRGSGGKNVRLNKGPRPESSICYTWKLRLWSEDKARSSLLFSPIGLFLKSTCYHNKKNHNMEIILEKSQYVNNSQKTSCICITRTTRIFYLINRKRHSIISELKLKIFST